MCLVCLELPQSEHISVAEATWLALNVVSGGGNASTSQPIGVTKIAKSVIAPLADHNISVFMLSTYQTDYILVSSDTCLMFAPTEGMKSNNAGVSLALWKLPLQTSWEKSLLATGRVSFIFTAFYLLKKKKRKKEKPGLLSRVFMKMEGKASRADVDPSVPCGGSAARPLAGFPGIHQVSFIRKRSCVSQPAPTFPLRSRCVRSHNPTQRRVFSTLGICCVSSSARAGVDGGMRARQSSNSRTLSWGSLATSGHDTYLKKKKLKGKKKEICWKGFP